MIWETGGSLGEVCTLYCCCLITKSRPTLFQPHELWPSRLLHPRDFSRPAYWSGLPFPPPGDLPNPGIKPRSPALQVAYSPLDHLGSPVACITRAKLQPAPSGQLQEFLNESRTTAEGSQNPTPSFFSDHHFLITVTAFSACCSWAPDIKHSIWCLTSWWLLRLHPELKLNTEVNTCLLFCGADPTHTWNSFCQLSAMPKHHYTKGHLILGSELAVMDGPWLCFL